MSIALAVRVQLEPVRSLGFASIGAGYMGVGTAVMNPIRIFHVQNLTNATLMFSFDGINDHFPLVASGFILVDVSSNQALTQGFYLAQGTRLYVKNIGSPSIGSVYFTVFYGSAIL